jgi:hypothetical protein
LRANNKPPVELVVANLDKRMIIENMYMKGDVERIISDGR